MDELNKKEEGGKCGCGDSCKCGGMDHMHHGCCGKHHLVKMILKIFIVILIFWCGFKLGLISGSIRGGEVRGGYGTMRGVYNLPSNGGVVVPTPAQ